MREECGGAASGPSGAGWKEGKGGDAGPSGSLAGPARSGPGAEGREKGGGVFIYLFIFNSNSFSYLVFQNLKLNSKQIQV